MGWFSNFFKKSQGAPENEIVQNPEKKNTFEIRQDFLPGLQKKLQSLINKANKLGLEPISLEVSKPYNKEFKDERGHAGYVQFVSVTIKGDAPVLAGWKLVARVVHLPDYKSATPQQPLAADPTQQPPQPQQPDQQNVIWRNVVNAAPNETIPPMYFNTPPYCEHCGWDRTRKDTFIVKNVETGEYKQIGRTCIRDFLGHPNPNMLASHYESLGAFQDLLEQTEKDSENMGLAPSGGWTGHTRNVDEILAIATALVFHKGFVSRKAADANPGMVSTSQHIYDALFDWNIGRYNDEDDERERETKPWLFPTDEQRTIAREARQWMLSRENEPGLNDFERNLVNICHQDVTSSQGLGRLVYLIPMYLQAHGKMPDPAWKTKKEKQEKSQFVGTPGNKVLSKVSLLETPIRFENNWGGGHITKLMDSNGNMYTLFNWPMDESGEGNPQPIQMGKEYYIWGTIKEHKDYKGTKSTVLTRAKIIPPDKINAYKKKSDIIQE